MKKVANVVNMLFLLIFTNIPTMAQEVPCRVVEISQYYDAETYEYVGDLQFGEIVYARNFGGYNTITAASEILTFNIRILKDDKNYLTYAKNLVPQDTQMFFDSDVIINYEENTALPNEMWVPLYYCEVLGAGDREILTVFEPDLLKYNTGDTFEYGIPMHWYLHWFTHIRSGMYMFYNSRIYASRNSFLIKKIEKATYGYIVSCLGPEEVDTRTRPNFDWSAYSGGEINLLLYVDGEYIDIYFNDAEHKFGTLVRVKEEFIRQYESLMETNTCDLTNVIWPRRADGSMDYPPPQSTQAAVTEQPEPTDVPPADYGEAAAPDLVEEAVDRQQQTGFPWVIAAVIAGIALAGTAFVVLRKKR
jgi:hypothetical protein